MSSKFTIGLAPLLSPEWGGLYSYSDALSRGVIAYSHTHPDLKYVLLTDQDSAHLANEVSFPPWQVTTLDSDPSMLGQMRTLMSSFVGEGPHREVWRWFRRAASRMTPATTFPLDNPHFREDIHQRLKRKGIDLVVYCSWQSTGFEARVPFIMPLFDVLHITERERFLHDFAPDGEHAWQAREYLMRNLVRYATLIVAESEQGKANILRLYEQYDVTEDRIFVLPLTPAFFLGKDVNAEEKLRVRQKFSLPDHYFFYPAQFWPHKNHENIIRALGLLEREQGLQLHCVFCGSASGEYRERHIDFLLSLADELRLRSRLHLLGRVDDDDMSGLFAAADALVMPTFFGPTNIPPLEAWAFGCPVITSDYGGIAEEMGDAALLVNPQDPASIADALLQLYTDDVKREELIRKGRQRHAAFTQSDYLNCVESLLNEARDRVQSGRMPKFPD